MLNKILTCAEAFIDWSGRSVSWLSLFLVLITFTIVVLRYVFDDGSIALQETTIYLHASVFLIGMAYTLQQDAHVRVDIFYANLSRRAKAWVDLLGTLFLLLPFMLFVTWISWQYIADSWSVFEGSREAGGLPGVFLLKSLIIVMTFLLSLQACTQIARNIQTILRLEQNNTVNNSTNNSQNDKRMDGD